MQAFRKPLSFQPRQTGDLSELNVSTKQRRRRRQVAAQHMSSPLSPSPTSLFPIPYTSCHLPYLSYRFIAWNKTDI